MKIQSFISHSTLLNPLILLLTLSCTDGQFWNPLLIILLTRRFSIFIHRLLHLKSNYLLALTLYFNSSSSFSKSLLVRNYLNSLWLPTTTDFHLSFILYKHFVNLCSHGLNPNHIGENK